MAKSANDFNKPTRGESGPNSPKNLQSGFSDVELDGITAARRAAGGGGAPDFDSEALPEMPSTHEQVAWERDFRSDFKSSHKK